MAAQFNASEFTASKAKPLPIILLLDTSGSMYGDKIRSLNDAVRKMLGTFTKEESRANQFLVSIITFGGTASLAYSPTAASELTYTNLSADGGTPLGAAIDVAKSLIEDREQTPLRIPPAGRPGVQRCPHRLMGERAGLLHPGRPLSEVRPHGPWHRPRSVRRSWPRDA